MNEDNFTRDGCPEKNKSPELPNGSLADPYQETLDLLGDPELIRTAYREVTDQIEKLQPWREAIYSYARQHKINLKD